MAAERERFARDLHDLVGHTLSLMLIKLQVANTILPDTARASAELVDLQHLARMALDDVREAVGGYRQPTLAAELSGARIALDAASIRLDVEDNAGPLPAVVEAVLAWGVREAVTNVIRHSDAVNCRIGITHDGDHVCLDVVDDGRGCALDTVESGLRSLRERVTAAGGRLSAGNRPRGGFAITVRMPVTAREMA